MDEHLKNHKKGANKNPKLISSLNQYYKIKFNNVIQLNFIKQKCN